jgi:hypothetical protein
MRCGSLVAPLLLIGIGALFLARNVMPELPLLDYLAQYWPWLLILWGTIRLLEIAVWAARKQALPFYGVSGGEWILVVFLCMLGISLHAVRGFTSWLPRAGIEWGSWEVFGDSYEYPVTAELRTSDTPRIVLEGFRGTARFVGGDGAMVKVSGHQTIRSMDQATADRLSADTRIEVANEDNQVVIRQILAPVRETFGQNRPSQRTSADLDIAVPRGATIVAKGRDGDFDISGVMGAVNVTAENASVRLENIGSDVSLDLTGGNTVRAVNLRSDFDLKGRGNDVDLEKIAGQVTITGSWGGLIQMRELVKPIRWKGPQTELTMQAVPGELRLTIGDLTATRVVGPLRIDSQNKDVTLTDVAGSTSISVKRGDIRITTLSVPLSDTNVRVEGGSVELSLPEKVKFNMNAVTDRGEAYSEYGEGVQQNSDERHGAYIRANGGGPNFDIHVNRGDITLRSNGGVQIAPTPLNSPKGKISTKELPVPVEQ